MHAWILDESPGEYRYGTIDTPAPGPDDVRVRVVASALNHMDLWLTKGMPRPRVPHVPRERRRGIVDAVGAEVAGIAAGDEVVINPAVSCRRCSACLAGEGPYCRRFQVLGEQRWGAHGEYVVVPAANVSPETGEPVVGGGGGVRAVHADRVADAAAAARDLPVRPSSLSGSAGACRAQASSSPHAMGARCSRRAGTRPSG